MPGSILDSLAYITKLQSDNGKIIGNVMYELSDLYISNLLMAR